MEKENDLNEQIKQQQEYIKQLQAYIQQLETTIRIQASVLTR